MFKVLQAVHPGKASMLGADAFMSKVKKVERKLNKKKSFDLSGAKSGIMSTQGSQDLIGKLDIAKHIANIESPLLIGMDKFITSLKEQFTETGATRMKDIEKALKEKANPVHDQKKNNQHGPLDTVEENLKRIESNR